MRQSDVSKGSGTADRRWLSQHACWARLPSLPRCARAALPGLGNRAHEDPATQFQSGQRLTSRPARTLLAIGSGSPVIAHALADAPSPSARTWALHCTLFRGQTPPRACLYVLADLRRGVALSAIQAEQPLGGALAAWLEAAAIGRPPPRALQSAELPSEQDRRALCAWIACLRPCSRAADSGWAFLEALDQLLQSAWESLGLAPGAVGEMPTWSGAQQGLDHWFREHCQHLSGV
ncbi:hypothetical protein LMG23994_07170 [Cupriavidus pinatubonensis]|uniref:Uncharacterized protein n=1 Tax=Cupriavidus pinatubonensis TaxID=248026 RepID=A0ABM8Y4M3_9BURK|nr:hypothetical protein LMG23994_07170 [Cupriavidus pinatubonensis]